MFKAQIIKFMFRVNPTESPYRVSIGPLSGTRMEISVSTDTWILRIYRRYIDEYFYMNIDISKINKKYFEIHENTF